MTLYETLEALREELELDDEQVLIAEDILRAAIDDIVADELREYDRRWDE
jgi:hypothetical protein